MEYRPVRTVREMWRLDMEAFHEGYEFAQECCDEVNPQKCPRSFYLGWVHGAHDRGRINADVEALRADMDLNLGASEYCH